MTRRRALLSLAAFAGPREVLFDGTDLRNFRTPTGLTGPEVSWRNRGTGAEETRAVSNVFLMLGAMPNTEWLDGCLELDEHGFVRCGVDVERSDWQTDRLPYALETSRRGVFAVGDVRSGSIKRVASGVGEGSIVVSAIHSILAEM